MLKWIKRKSQPTIKISIKFDIEKDGDGYLGTAPAFPGLLIGGETKHDVQVKLLRGIAVYIEMLEEDDRPLPVGPDFMIELSDKVKRAIGFKARVLGGNPKKPYPLPNAKNWMTATWPTPRTLEIS